MQAARCVPALWGGRSDDLATDTVSHRWNFVAARTDWVEHRRKALAIGGMSVGKALKSGGVHSNDAARSRDGRGSGHGIVVGCAPEAEAVRLPRLTSSAPRRLDRSNVDLPSSMRLRIRWLRA